MNMSPRIPLLCGRRSCLNGQCGSGGFTLLELVLVLFVLGAQDQMTQAKAAQALIDEAKRAGKQVEVQSLAVGHHQMTEAPEATLLAIKDFLRK